MTPAIPPVSPASRPAPGLTDAALRRYLDGCSDRVPAFTARHFSLRGSLRLHGSASASDIARAPVNIALGICNLASDLLGRLALRLRLRRLGNWFRSRHWMLETAVSRQLDRMLRVELLHWPLHRDGSPTGVDGLAAAVLQEARERGLLADPPAAATAVTATPPPELAREVDRLFRHYLASRTAMAEITVALASTLIGWWLFGAFAPGAIALSLPLAEAFTLDQAVQAFPLGREMGLLWYGMFGVDTPWPVTAVTATCLTFLFALAAAFAGLVTDPLERLTGAHRRRLRRLVQVLGARLRGESGAKLPAHEQYLARLADLLDIVQAATRGFR